MALIFGDRDEVIKPLSEDKARVYYNELYNKMLVKDFGLEGIEYKLLAGIIAFGLDINKVSSEIGVPVEEIRKGYTNLEKNEYFSRKYDALVLDTGSKADLSLAALIAKGFIERNAILKEK